MRGVPVRLVTLCLASLLLVTSAMAAPKLSDAKIEPVPAQIGDHVVMTVVVDDAAKEVARVEAVVVEYPEVTLPLKDDGQGDDKQAGDGIWTAGLDVPAEAPPGTYHIALWPRDASGKAFEVDGKYVKETVALTLQYAQAAPRVPKLSDAKIEPSAGRIGDHVVITVTIEDPANEVAKVETVVNEYPEVMGYLTDDGQGDDKQAGDGVWSGGSDVPVEAPPGTYHISIWPRDATGKAFEVDGKYLRETLVFSVTLEAPAAAGVPKLSAAKLEPSAGRIGDHVVITVALEDSAKEVAKVEAIVNEYPEVMLYLNDEGRGDDKHAGDGVWSAGTDIPVEAPPGTYHISIWPRDATGKAFEVDGKYVKETLVFSVTLEAPAPAGVPKLSDAKIAPAAAKPGDHVVLTVAVADPGKAVAKVEATVTEYPVMVVQMNDAGEGDDQKAADGVWTYGFDIPEAPAGTYHFEIWPRDAESKPFEADGAPVKATVPLELKAQELPDVKSAEELLKAAEPWRTEAQIAKVKAIGRKAGESFRFVAMGDTRSNPAVFGKLLQIAAGLPKFDFSLNTGDIVPGGKPEEYAFFFEQIKDVTWPFLIAEGNHELGPTGGRLYEELFGSPDYYFDHAGFRFLALNNSKGVVTPQQLQWLDDALTTDLRKVVFFHAPPACIEEWSYHAFSAGAQELADLLAEKKVERVYIGHIHALDVADYKGVRYVLTGGGGAGLHERMAPGNIHHIVLVEVLPDGLKETVYKDDGTSFVLDAQKWISGEGQ
ncbi:MAG: metallophosphoesterase [Armatimonadota bacterium]|nr:MAG: metallophosphoesterase [Armatimonadota bacterium]